jgi:hypothetical protein
MERRSEQRIRRRLSCELFADGHRYQGIVVDLSASGLFLQTDAALDPGTRVDVLLKGSRFPEVIVRAVVARRRLTPTLLASVIHRGVGLHIVEAPDAYYEALREFDELKSSLERAVEVLVSTSGLDGTLDPERVETPHPASRDAVDDSFEFVEEVPRPATAGAEGEPTYPVPVEAARSATPAVEAAARSATPEAAPAPAGEAASAAVEEPGAGAPAPDGWLSPAPSYPSLAILLDDGELDDVFAILQDLGANPILHRRCDAAGFRGWASAPRVFVASARSALFLRLPPNAAAEDVVTVAVAEAQSQLLVTMLRRQGFQYVVRRPVHPEALRLLLLRALYRNANHRGETRVPFGCEVPWRIGWKTRRGTLVELSSSGCRLLSPVAVEPASRVSLRIPRELAGGRDLSLGGRVVRFERQGKADKRGQVVLAIAFEGLRPRTQQRLDTLLAAKEAVPLTLPRKARAVGPTAARPGAPPPLAVARDPGANERRLHRRAVFDREVVVLDAGEERVKQVLVGRDLSVGGLRVDAHPDLALGDRLRVALYDATAVAPLVVEAEVVREDGERGVVVGFLEPEPKTLRRLRQIVAQLPAVEDLRPRESGSRGVVLAEILPRRIRA